MDEDVERAEKRDLLSRNGSIQTEVTGCGREEREEKMRAGGHVLIVFPDYLLCASAYL